MILELIIYNLFGSVTGTHLKNIKCIFLRYDQYNNMRKSMVIEASSLIKNLKIIWE